MKYLSKVRNIKARKLRRITLGALSACWFAVAQPAFGDDKVTYNPLNGKLHLPEVHVGDDLYEADLKREMIDGSMRFVLQKAELLSVPQGTGKVILRNAALVITADPKLGEGALGVIENGDVLFENDQIVKVGQNITDPDATVIDVTGKMVLPGFVDTHNHLWQSLIRGCGADKNVGGWIGECTATLKRPDIIDEKSAYATVRLSTLDVIATGVTTVVEWTHSYTPGWTNGSLRALEESGLRYVFAYYISVGGEQRIADIKCVKETVIDPNPVAYMQIGGHPTRSRIERLIVAADLAQELKVPLNVHLLENIEDRDDEPIKVLEDAGAFKPTLIVNHAVHLTDDEITFLAEKDVRVAHNPLSNMRLASGIMRFPDMHKAGMKIGLGLDGGTNDTSDMFATMKTAVGLQRALLLKADVSPTLEEILLAATMGGAQVLGMEDTIGSLTPGKQADIIVLKTDTVNFAPHWHPINQIVLNGRPSNVEYVFVNGRALKVKGKLLGVPEKEIVQAAEQAVQRIKDLLQQPEGEPEKLEVCSNGG